MVHGRDFQGIGLVEVLWKTITGLLNQSSTFSIEFHDVLHRFRTRSGTGNASLKAKLLQYLMVAKDAVFCEIFLYLRKAYNTLEMYRCL